MIKQGDILNNKYEILKLRGIGGMSKVWLALDTNINKQWAVKEIDKSSEEYKKTVDETKTIREIEIMKRLDHPSLPRVVDIIDSPDSLCIVMDYIEGDSLHEILRTRGVPEQETVASWVLDICDTLGYLHSFDPPIIYRDMKPANVMLTRDQRIKIIDFGIAKDYRAGYEDTQPLGTRGYASPEHFSQNTDIRSDVYTVGTTMYQLLTGKDPSKPPYYMVPIRKLNPLLSSGLEKIIIKATAENPDDRYQSMTELANAIESYKSLEQDYIEALEKKEKSLKRGFFLSGALSALGLLFISASIIIAGRTYKGLLETTSSTKGAVPAYERAIALDPSKEEAYEKLLLEYSGNGEFTDEELSAFARIYDEGKTSLSKNKEGYSTVNYRAGEAVLTYYKGKTDSSARAKLLQAEPFFSEVKEGEYAPLAKCYVFLGEYYRNYILADSSLSVKGASKEDLEEMLSSCNEILSYLQEENFSGSEKMKAIVSEVILNLVSSQASSFHEARIEAARAEELVDSIEKDSGLTPENAALAKEAREALRLGYQEKKEAGSGNT